MLLNLRPLCIVAILWAVIMWAIPWLSARTQFLKQPAAQGARTLLVDETGIRWRWSGGSSDVEWRNYIRYFESKRMFLLYLSPVVFNMVPKRALTAVQISEFRRILEQKIPKGR